MGRMRRGGGKEDVGNSTEHAEIEAGTPLAIIVVVVDPRDGKFGMVPPCSLTVTSKKQKLFWGDSRQGSIILEKVLTQYLLRHFLRYILRKLENHRNICIYKLSKKSLLLCFSLKKSICAVAAGWEIA